VGLAGLHPANHHPNSTVGRAAGQYRVGNQPNEPGDPPYNRMSFTFRGGYPTYSSQYADKLVQDGSGTPIPIEGPGVLRIGSTGPRRTLRTARHPRSGPSHRRTAAGDYEAT